MKGDLIVAIGGNFFEVAVPSFARIETKLLSRPTAQQFPGALRSLARIVELSRTGADGGRLHRSRSWSHPGGRF